MRIVWQMLFWIITFFCFVKSRNYSFLLNDHSDGNLFADILKKVLKTSQSKDAVLVLQDSLLNGQADDIVKKLFATVSQHVPSLYINTDRTVPQFHISSCVMSRGLLMYIYVSEHEPDIIEGKLIAENISLFIHDHVRPKVLILMILRQPCRNLAPLFRAMWSKKILDIIIVEHSKSEYSVRHPTIIHRFDPFIDRLTREPYSVDTTWFTDKFPNMQDYPLVYAISRRLPYIDIVLDSTGHVQQMKGVDHMVITTLAEKMNFTAIPKIIMDPVYLITMPNGTQHGIVLNVTSGKYDAILNTVPMFVYQIYPYVEFTNAVNVENWCFVVPRLYIEHSFIGTNAILLFFVSFLIVGIFWLCSKLMRFNPGRWHPLKIIGIMLNTSFPSAPTKMHERIVFFSIFAACSSYSSTLFAELTSLSLENNHYVHFDRLEDLMNSNLAVMMHINMLDTIVQHNSILQYHVSRSNKKILNVTLMETCLKDLLIYQNVSCFMEQNMAKLAEVNNMRNGQTMLKITKLCYLSPPCGNVFPKGSPYLKRVTYLSLMLAEAGLRNKWHGDYLHNETKETIFKMHRDQNSDYTNILYPLFYVLIFGNLISVFVFIGELIWKHFDIKLPSSSWPH